MLLRLVFLASLILGWSILSSPARATDGVLEINQACAVSTGCFPGDVARFPVTIDQPGSYRLTSDLVVPDVNTTAISIATDGVSIDLNGFAIRGPNTCSPGSCNSASTGGGVVQDSVLANRHRINVRNGLIVGVGGFGIAVGDEAHIDGVSITGVGGSGIAGYDRKLWIEGIDQATYPSV